MAKKSMIEKCKRQAASGKFSSRTYTRCNNCGRPKAVYRKFGICRICFRLMALRGLLPGIRKASW